MRILLTSNASYDPPRGGSTRSNLAWLRHLAAQGHECVVVSPTIDGAPGHTTVVDAITIHSVKELSFHVSVLGDHISALKPDWVLVSSEDVSHVLLREAGAVAPGRIIYLAHTPQFYPFGPESWNRDNAGTDIARSAASVVAIGHHMAGYIKQHLGREAVVIHPPMYGQPPYRQFGRFASGYVLMINPCAVKGVSIFLDLAARFPDIEFAALNGWGTTAADRVALERQPNTRLLKNVPDIEEVLEQARLLLMPSVWYEGFGLIAMEAMLRGLPVIASNSGGLMEAKTGTGYVVPVRPVDHYERVFDDTLMPRAIVPPQDLEPWAAALHTLLTNESAYWREARQSRDTALRFVEKLDVADFERHLLALPAATQPIGEHKRVLTTEEKLKALDPAKRALLLARLKQKKEQS
ncbi:glycosyltransferase family 4 protein [uncultured Paludibaculum sp.]|uniref:glycosyltransferase family 4 protein n=1 Tax=uncultured Paludibaculum sp. TaxID=1765020 RepID=UPI002AAA6B3E|nr:glycosyltransferase family 4 protein [uncultured Paludibaculum sp.]